MPFSLALKADALYLADRASEALRLSKKHNYLAKVPERLPGVPNCTGFAACFSRLLVPRRRKLRLRSAKPSESHGSRNRFRYRNAPKEPTQNFAGKKQAGQEDVDSDYLLLTHPVPCLSNQEWYKRLSHQQT